MNEFRTEEERKVVLTPIEEKVILGADTSFQSINGTIYFDNYDLPCPILVTVNTTYGEQQLVLRKTRHGDVGKEAAILRALKEFGLPVPEIIAAPFKNESGEQAAVYSLLPGENLQKLSSRSDKELEQAKSLLIEAVGKLMTATDAIANSEIGKSLPRYDLSTELKSVHEGNPWHDESAYQAASAYLEKVIPDITTPLVLSNGDYQPGNFLAENGKITGFIDFESPSFQDPLIGFAKYPIYDLRPLSGTDLVDSFLKEHGFTTADFNIRVALMCLKILKKEVPVTAGGAETERYRKHILNLLAVSIQE